MVSVLLKVVHVTSIEPGTPERERTINGTEMWNDLTEQMYSLMCLHKPSNLAAG